MVLCCRLAFRMMILRPARNLKIILNLLHRRNIFSNQTCRCNSIYKSTEIRRIGHIVRIGKERTVKRITEWRPIAVRRIGTTRIMSGRIWGK
jgi:hypothetical protein